MRIFIFILWIVACVACKKSAVSKGSDFETQKTDTLTQGALLKADGKTDTYQLINSVLGGTGDVVETPDCAHPAGAPHILQVYDQEQKAYVFAFIIHLSPDNDRCLPTTDRQRNEIKTYAQSPDSLLALKDESVTYKWRFKLDENFQPSPNFTHLHQLKALDGDDDLPLITLTARYKSSGNRLEVIHTGGTGKSTSLKYLASVPLDDFLGQWVEVSEKVTFSYKGKYELTIGRVVDNKQLLNINVSDIDLWRDATTRCRPKWGIYRSLITPEYLRDETVRFNQFQIIKIK